MIELVIERQRHAYEIAPSQKLRKPTEYLRESAKLVAAHEPGLFNRLAADQAPDWRCRDELDKLEQALQFSAFYRLHGLDVTPPAGPLAIAVDNGRVSNAIRRVEQSLKELRSCRVVVLAKAKELLRWLLQQPVQVAEPVQPVRLDHHA